MTNRVAKLIALLLALLPAPLFAASLAVDRTVWVLTTDDGRRLDSPQLVGAIFDAVDPDGSPATLRIDAVTPSKERPEILLHTLSAKAADGSFQPVCDADAYGRRAGFPVAGSIDAQGRYTRPPGKWYLTCTSGAQGKCILWGYDPGTPGPGGRDLAPYYQACMHMVRGDYDGSETAHTKNGTTIDMWDDVGVQTNASKSDPAFAFEAGWGPDGAVCVARTRWADLLPVEALLASAPRLRAAPCNEAEARRRGALIFNRSKIAP